jgi:hypothetical protein
MGFHGSRFFKVLGRIDEESTFRASLSNMTSQDSSPRSSSNDSEANDWLTPLSPESYSTHSEKMSPAHNNIVNSNSNSNISSSNMTNSNNHNVTVVATVTNVEDANFDAAASTERRQDRSSPIHPQSQTPSLPPNDSELLLRPCPSAPVRNRSQQQQHPQPQQKEKKEEQIKRENEALQKECEELESMILQMQTESNILQVRTARKLQNYKAQIERATEEKQFLQRQCQQLEDKVWDLRTETRLKQESIWATEEKLRRQAKQHKRVNDVAKGDNK